MTAPTFTLDAILEHTPGNPVESTDGRKWQRVVIDSNLTACAAEDERGTLIVWDEAELFESAFRLMERL